MKIARRNDGFTLVEIVIVIGIMAVLTAIVYSSLDASRANSRDQKRVSDISAIQISLEQYFQKNGVYPLQLSLLVPTYISEIPKDPSTNIDYSANYFPMSRTATNNSDKCTSYQLWTKFERNNSFLLSKKGFDSTSLSLYSLYDCGGGHTGINASTTATALVYDVMP